MIVASATDIDEGFRERLKSALSGLPPRRLSLVETIKCMNGRRFVKADRAAAAAALTDYLAAEYAEFGDGKEGLEARYIIDLPDRPAATLTCLVKLSAPSRAPSGYGCSARRIGEEAYVVDLHSPVFGLLRRATREIG